MKQLIAFWMLVTFWGSCSDSPKPSRTNSVTPKENIKRLIDSFVTVNGEKSKIYELYIDKTSPNEYNLILYSGEVSLTKQEDSLYDNYPINIIQTSKAEFKIYSGIEHFFQGSTSLNKKIDDQKVINNYRFKMWTVRDSAGILSIQESYGGYPFMPFPNKLPDSLSLNHPSDKLD